MKLDRLFAPKSICIIGASEDVHKIGHIALKNILTSGYTGDVYPVNKSAKEILSIRCYISVSTLPKIPDLAIIAIPSTSVNEVLTELGEFGVKNIVVFSAGFKEVGDEGCVLESTLVSIADKYAMNILGPNCLGFLNTSVSLNATFSEYLGKKGSLRFISQSGAIASSVFDWIKVNGLGVDEFITLGNKSVISENDVLSYFMEKPNNAENPKYMPIALYLESIQNGPEFLDLVSHLTPKNPVMILKPGKSDSAKKAMLSHTGSIAGEYKVMRKAFEQVGLIHCNGLEELFDYTMAFSWEKAPKGANVAIISNAGGPGVISSDLVDTYGLKLAVIPDEIQTKLHKVLPRAVSLLNPIDLLGDALSDRYKQALEAVLPLDTVDSVVVLLTPQVMTQIEATAKVIGEVAARHKKPVLCSFIGGNAFALGHTILCRYNVANYEFPERAIKTLGVMWQWQKWVNRPVNALVKAETDFDVVVSKTILDNILHEKSLGNKSLSYTTTAQLANEFGLILPKSKLVSGVSDAMAFMKEAKYPVVLKIVAPTLLHKTEESGVTTNISNEESLKVAFEQLYAISSNIKDSKLLIQEQVSGVEVICGVRTDSVFGDTLLFGAGGTLAELIDDANLLIGDFNTETVTKLILDAKIYKVLSGYRGKMKYNIDAVVKTLLAIVSIKKTYTDICDIEVNPLIVTKDQALVVDLKMLL